MTDNSIGYCFPNEIVIDNACLDDQDDDFQEQLSKVNEKEARGKKEGVYYTDRDVTDFLAVNTLLHFVVSSESKVFGFDKAITKLDRLNANLKRKYNKEVA